MTEKPKPGEESTTEKKPTTGKDEKTLYGKESNENLLSGLVDMKGEGLEEVKEEINKRIDKEWKDLSKEKTEISNKLNKTEEDEKRIKYLDKQIENIDSELKKIKDASTGEYKVGGVVVSLRKDIEEYKKKEEEYKKNGDFEKMKKMEKWQKEKRSRLRGDSLLKLFDVENSKKREFALEEIKTKEEKFSDEEKGMTKKEVIEKINNMKGERGKEERERMTTLLGIVGAKEFIELLQKKDKLEIKEEEDDFSVENEEELRNVRWKLSILEKKVPFTDTDILEGKLSTEMIRNFGVGIFEEETLLKEELEKEKKKQEGLFAEKEDIQRKIDKINEGLNTEEVMDVFLWKERWMEETRKEVESQMTVEKKELFDRDKETKEMYNTGREKEVFVPTDSQYKEAQKEQKGNFSGIGLALAVSVLNFFQLVGKGMRALLESWGVKLPPEKKQEEPPKEK